LIPSLIAKKKAPKISVRGAFYKASVALRGSTDQFLDSIYPQTILSVPKLI